MTAKELSLERKAPKKHTYYLIAEKPCPLRAQHHLHTLTIVESGKVPSL
jgi:hypothetical protein